MSPHERYGRLPAGRGRLLAGALLVLLACLLVLGAGTARASTTAPAGCASPQARVNHALSTLTFPWRNLHYRYVAMPPRADGILALTWTGTIRRTEVYVEPCSEESDSLLRHVIAHEVGHAIDGAWGSTPERLGWLKARHLATSTTWYACDACPVWDSGEGDFVEVFSLWQTGQFHSGIARQPSRAQLRQLVRLIPRHAPARPAPASAPDPGTVTAPSTPPSAGDAPPADTGASPAPAPSPAPSPSPSPSPTCGYLIVIPVCR